MPKASVNGVEVFYEVSGSGQPVLYIHGGYGGPASALVPGLPSEMVSILPEDQFQVITYDRRGFGRSDVPCVVTMAGGYCPDIDVIARIHANTLREAAECSKTGP